MILFCDRHLNMALGLLLASLLPTSGMTISWTGFAKGNIGAAINMTVIGLTLGSLLTPFYVQFLMGAKVDVNILMVVQQIVLIVFMLMLLGFITPIALVYGTVMRNLSIALAIAINTFGSQGADAALVIAISYIIQVQAAAWYVTLTDRIFGPVPAAA